MKAMVFTEHGEVDRLHYTDVAEPAAGPGEVKVKVEACALNHLDIWVRLGGRPVPVPMPHISGSDIAGTVAEIGEGVKGIEIGRRLIVAPGLSCGQCEFCLNNNDSACADFKIMGFQVQGGYAEYAIAPARNIIPVSDRFIPEEWSAMPLVFVTAWHMLFARAGLRCGETVLVQAAGSGVGSAAIQLAKLSGARVLATAGSQAKLDAAQALGADEVINYREEDFVVETMRRTHGRGVDVVIEHIGGETLTKSLGVLAKMGRLVNCGVTTGAEGHFNILHLFAKQQTIHGSYMGSLSELKTVVRLAEEGKIRPVVDRVFPLAEARAAQQRMLDRENFGKIVLKP
jgi:NADPH:quinone reductase-like Zn-dependent oxidoreductase